LFSFHSADLIPRNWTVSSWNFPFLISVSGEGGFLQEVEVHGCAIAFVLRQVEEGMSFAEVCLKAGIAEATCYNWRTTVGDFSFQCMKPLHISLMPGTRYLPGGLTFNPNFSAWLMGWPIGWSDPEPPVTALPVWLQRMRGKLDREWCSRRNDIPI